MSCNSAVLSLHMDRAHEPIHARCPAGREGRSTARPGRICAFRCAYRTSLSEYDHGGVYLGAYEGDLHVFLDENREQLAGHTRIFVLNADAAERDGESLFNLLDQRPETAPFIALLGDAEGELSPAVCELLGEPVAVSRNMLLLDCLEILPPFRGQELGLKYLAAAITRFGLGCRFVAMRPAPVTEGGARAAAGRTANTKLKKYFMRAGFVSVKRSELMILDLENPRPRA
jgi:hypothetical protein